MAKEGTSPRKLAGTSTRYQLAVFRKLLLDCAVEYSRIILFGSRAGGYDKPTSDIDICLILPDADRKKSDLDSVAKKLRIKLGLLGIDCDLLVYRESVFAAKSISPILHQIKKNGIDVTQPTRRSSAVSRRKKISVKAKVAKIMSTGKR